jgi:hypothetical protein
MSNEPLATITWHDARQVAQVLEGFAGTLQEGLPVDWNDLEAVTESIEWVWQAGPKPSRKHDLDFEEARRDFDRASKACAAGANEIDVVAASAHRLAGHLRQLAKDSQEFSARKELPVAVGHRIDRLARKYARFAVRSTQEAGP